MPATTVRCLTPPDIAPILTIETASYPVPWDRNDFADFMKRKSGTGIVLELDGQVTAYLVGTFRSRGRKLDIANLTVKACWRRHGFGSRLVRFARTKFHADEATVCLREHDLAGQLFFQSLGHQWFMTFPRSWDDPVEDGYLLTWTRGHLLDVPDRIPHDLRKKES